MTSLTTYRTRLSEDYTRDPNNRIWNLNAVDRAINKWYEKVQEDLQWSIAPSEETATISLTSWVWSLPSDFVRMSWVLYNDDELARTTKKEIETLFDDDTNNSPICYYIRQGNLWVYPTNASSVTIGYYNDQATITTSQDSLLPESCDDAILLYATYKLFLWVRDKESAWLFLWDYQTEINKLRLKLWANDDNMVFTIKK